ncbi:prolactin-releasing peptide receptor-like [Chrysoperla carnea]|uniref:prolactin-releasing peptide receptor-like n=1 Tax=Chrysoperla carnea TaxID=189513 RepID=UPI001D060BBE|nr:prolactin-releasing peptide receptor-like [Chrysoperla carnea]
METSTFNLTSECSNNTNSSVIQNSVVKGGFYFLYFTIFTLGIIGNALVCHVVYRNKAMQTVTNIFIMNLALSDILLCVLAVPFTPLYSFMGRWIFGRIICHLVPYAQGTSIYISTLTLTSIAIDRYFVIIYPLRPRMRLSTCIGIIIGIWVLSMLLTLPYGIYMEMKPWSKSYVCEENWPNGRQTQRIFGSFTSFMQFILPFFIIAYCYICVSIRLNDRAKMRRGTNARREEVDRERKKRTNRMLIAMVSIFVISWLPLNLINVANDFYEPSTCWTNLHVYFFMGHCLAMSSTCYNPFLYAWLNENFRKEFKQVLPCFVFFGRHHHRSLGRRLTERTTINGTETIQDTLLHSVINGGDHSPIKHLEPREPLAAPINNHITNSSSHHQQQLHAANRGSNLFKEESICMTGLPVSHHNNVETIPTLQI